MTARETARMVELLEKWAAAQAKPAPARSRGARKHKVSSVTRRIEQRRDLPQCRHEGCYKQGHRFGGANAERNYRMHCELAGHKA